ncbi:MAG: CusA/CzcA family heavy metal efflux RND transporter [Bacteroidales bacterium]|nr:CusA/CzcA family heavy metal efflux RND transporter [Candidatus Latescibacterota bacterium]
MINKIIQYALKYKWMIVLGFAAICGLGLYSLPRLSIDAFPDISPNLVQVFAELEGMAAEEVERFVTMPVEVAMRGIPGVKKVRSISSLGLSTVNIYFEDDVDIYLARQLVSERIGEAEEDIPQIMNMTHGLEMGAIASGMGKILAYYLKGDGHDIAELRTLQDWIVKRDIQTQSGIAKVISQGGHVRQYQIKVDPGRLQQFDLTLDDLIDATRMNNLNLGAGILERGQEELVVRTLGLIDNIEDIERIVIHSFEGTPVSIGDVARVEYGNAFRRGVAIFDGVDEIVTGSVYKTYGANSFEVIERLKERIEEINSMLPDGVEVVTYYDQSSLVRNSINTVRTALILGLVLVCLVSFLFLGNLRNALIVLCSLPFSTLFAFIIMYRSNIPGDLISFGGVAIALGMIVDATIIMVEKIQTKFDDSIDLSTPTEKILSAVGEVGRPIFFATVIIIIVFIPVFTLGEIEGKMFRPLASAISVTMAGALIYALVIAPVFYRLLHRRGNKSDKSRVSGPVMLDHYKSVLQFFLRRRLTVISGMVLLVLAGGLMFKRLGREFVPTLQEGTIQVLAYMNPNISLNEITVTTREISQIIMEFDEIESVIADIGYGEVGPHMHHTNYACITVNLKPGNEWTDVSSQEELVSLIDEKVGGYPGVTYSFSQPVKHEIDGLVGGAGTAVVVRVFGHDMALLKEKADEINSILSDIRGASDVRTEQVDGQTQLQIIIDDEQVARYGLNGYRIQNMIQNSIAGIEVGQVFEGDRSFDITARFDEDFREDQTSIARMLIKTPDGFNVPVSELAEIKTVTGLRQISREDTRRYVSVQCNVRGRDNGGFVREAQDVVADSVDLPPGYRIAWGGQFELQEAADRRLAIIMPITLLFVLILLYGLFNSFKDVLLIMLNIPLALVGGVFALALAGENVSIPSSIGFIALFGIALTDGLVLISRFGYLRKQGLDLRETVIAGSLSKFRPVLMTTVTTALGLLPLVLSSGTGSEVQRPLAIVVIGGLISSTFLTLIVLPVLYEWITIRTRQA